MILNLNKQTILIVIIHHSTSKSRMLKILEFYVLLLFTVGYHGNQNIFVSIAGEMSNFLFTKNWRLQLKCLQFRNLCNMVIIRNQWINEYFINLDNRKLNFLNSKITKMAIIPLFSRIKENNFAGCFVSK